jgi:hypothetical protein
MSDLKDQTVKQAIDYAAKYTLRILNEGWMVAAEFNSMGFDRDNGFLKHPNALQKICRLLIWTGGKFNRTVEEAGVCKKLVERTRNRLYYQVDLAKLSQSQLKAIEYAPSITREVGKAFAVPPSPREVREMLYRLREQHRAERLQEEDRKFSSTLKEIVVATTSLMEAASMVREFDAVVEEHNRIVAKIMAYELTPPRRLSASPSRTSACHAGDSKPSPRARPHPCDLPIRKLS